MNKINFLTTLRISLLLATITCLNPIYGGKDRQPIEKKQEITTSLPKNIIESYIKEVAGSRVKFNEEYKKYNIAHGGQPPASDKNIPAKVIPFKAGNVLAYYNIKGQVIILKSGDYIEKTSDVELRAIEDGKFSTKREVRSGKAITIPLEDVLSLVASGEGFVNKYKRYEGTDEIIQINPVSGFNPNKKIKKEVIEKYCDLIKEHQAGSSLEWERYILDPKRGFDPEISTIKKYFDSIKTSEESNLMSRLKNLGHTEFQVAALFQKWIDPEKKCDVIKSLLPASLVNPKATVDKNIYSIFEPCRSCQWVKWLTEKSNRSLFYFKVLDGQITDDYKKKLPDEKKVPYLGKKDADRMILCDFMNQKTLEESASYKED